MKKTRRRIDVNLVELDQVLDSALEAPLSEADHDKLKDTLHALAALLVRERNTEKTGAVVGEQEGSPTGTQPDDNAPPPPGHGRNGAEAFGGARKVDIKHQKLTHGDRCPECGQGNVYGQKERVCSPAASCLLARGTRSRFTSLAGMPSSVYAAW